MSRIVGPLPDLFTMLQLTSIQSLRQSYSRTLPLIHSIEHSFYVLMTFNLFVIGQPRSITIQSYFFYFACIRHRISHLSTRQPLDQKHQLTLAEAKYLTMFQMPAKIIDVKIDCMKSWIIRREDSDPASKVNGSSLI